MGYSKFALAFFLGGGVRGGNKLDVAWVMWGVGAHTMWGIFIFPSLMTKSDKKKTPSLAGMHGQPGWPLGSASWGHILEALLSGPCWGGSSVWVSSSASVACACRWWLQSRGGGELTVSGEEAGQSSDSPSLPLSAGARPVDGELRNVPQSCPILFPWVGFFIHLP